MEVIIHQEDINEHKLFVFSSYCPKSGIFHPKLDETIQNRRESSEIGRNQPKWDRSFQNYKEPAS